MIGLVFSVGNTDWFLICCCLICAIKLCLVLFWFVVLVCYVCVLIWLLVLGCLFMIGLVLFRLFVCCLGFVLNIIALVGWWCLMPVCVVLGMVFTSGCWFNGITICCLVALLCCFGLECLVVLDYLCVDYATCLFALNFRLIVCLVVWIGYDLVL